MNVVDTFQRSQRRIPAHSVEPQRVLGLHYAGVEPVNGSRALDAAVIANGASRKNLADDMRDEEFRHAFDLWKFDSPKIVSHVPPRPVGHRAAAWQWQKVYTTGAGRKQKCDVVHFAQLRRSCPGTEHYAHHLTDVHLRERFYSITIAIDQYCSASLFSCDPERDCRDEQHNSTDQIFFDQKEGV